MQLHARLCPLGSTVMWKALQRQAAARRAGHRAFLCTRSSKCQIRAPLWTSVWILCTPLPWKSTVAATPCSTLPRSVLSARPQARRCVCLAHTQPMLLQPNACRAEGRCWLAAACWYQQSLVGVLVPAVGWCVGTSSWYQVSVKVVEARWTSGLSGFKHRLLSKDHDKLEANADQSIAHASSVNTGPM